MRLKTAYKKANNGSIIKGSSIPGSHVVGMKKGGSPLNRPITCSSCGHSWTVSDSGPNPLSCHNCGGVAKMPNGGVIPTEADYYSRLRTAKYNVLEDPIRYDSSSFRDGGKYLPTAVSQELARKKEGGKVDHSNDDDMVNGVASILRRVKDKKNRLQLANQLSSQFNREKVKYDLNDFLNKSKVKK